MDTQVFTRKELYDLVWSQPLSSIAKKYNISDVGLRKICIKMSIPNPQVGYWQKKKAKKKAYKVPLPTNYKGDQNVTLKLRDQNDKKASSDRAALLNLQIEIEKHLKSKLKVPVNLINPDNLIIATRDRLLSKKPDNELYIGTVSRNKEEYDILDVRVTPANISRMLRFMDTLIKALRARGHDVQIRNGETCAIIENEDFRISFREKMKMVSIKDDYRSKTVYHPTGILSLNLGREWKDGDIKLEAQLSKIIAHLELDAKKWKVKRIEWEKQWEEDKANERLQQQLKVRQVNELAEFIKLIEKASRWNIANNLRSYIDAAEQKAMAGNSEITQDLKDQLHWARNKADWYDPLIEADDELMINVDRETLTIED